MNLLIDKLPDAVACHGVAYKVYTDFKVGIRIILAFEDALLTMQEKQGIMVSLLYETVPDDFYEAAKQAAIFLNGGVTDSEPRKAPRVYSFAKDANFIFAAFRQTHGIDLQQI